MKKILFAAILLMPLLSQAQSSNGTSYKIEDKYVYYGNVVQVDTSFTVSDLVKDAKVFITKMGVPNVTPTIDEKSGLVTADVQEPGTYKNATSLGNEDMTLKYSLKLELKKGRYRYTFDNIVIIYEDGGRNTSHTLYDLDKSASGVLGNPRSKRILKAMDGLFAAKIELLTNTMKKKSDDF